jgi:hypothetical protein
VSESTPEPTPEPAPPAGKPRAHWAYRLLVGIVEGVAALAGIVLLGVLLLALRLAWGPLAVDWMTPALTQALDAEVDPLAVTMTGTSITWGTGQPTFDLIARDLRVADPAGAELLALPSLEISVSAAALVQGRLEPTRLIATGPRLHIVRARSGEIGVTPGTQAADDSGPTEPWPQMLRALAGKPRPGDPLGVLNQISVVGLEATIDDKAAGLTWHLTDGTATAARSPTGLEARSSGKLTLGAATMTADATLHLDTDHRTAAYDGRFTGLDPSAIAGSLPASYGDLKAVRVALDGRFDGTLDVGAMRLGLTSLTMHAGPGAIVDPRMSRGRLDLKGVDLEAVYDPDRSLLALRRLAVDLDGPTVELTGQAVGAGTPGLAGPSKIKGRIDLHSLPLDRFGSVWPPTLAPDTREWITTNLSTGILDALKVDATVDFDPTSSHPFGQPVFQGMLTVSNGTVDYLRGLPPVTGVDAQMALSPQKLDFTITSGHLAGLTVPKASVVIDAFDEPVERLTIDAGITGSATEVLKVLDSKRLQYAKAIGLEPERVVGTVDGTLHFRLRLKKDLPFSEIEYGAHAKLTELAIAGAALGKDLTDGTFDLTLDRDKVALDGTGRLDNVPATIAWQQRISADAGGPLSQVHALARLDRDARQRFAFDVLPDIVPGPVDADITYRVEDDHQSSADVRLDLSPSEMGYPLGGWHKPADDPGTARFRVVLADGRVARIESLEARAKDLDLAGGVEFDNGRLSRITFDHLTLGRNQIAGTVDHPETDAWVLKLRGPVMDFAPIQAELSADSKNPPAPGDEGPTLDLDMAADRLIIGPDRELQQVTFRGLVARRTLTTGTIAAHIGKAGKLAFQLDPVDQGGKFSIDTDDLGAFAKVAGINDNLVGGSLTVAGSSRQEGDARRFTGHADGRNYRLVNMPFMTRLLSLASFQTVASLLAGEGIPFTTLKADLSMKDGVIAVDKGRAYGGAIGLTADGEFNTREGTLHLDGTLVPAYTLNSALGNVPVLGPLLIGQEGSGLFAVNIGIYGQLAEPTISVNPLSVVAPGFLRNLFLFDAPGPSKPAPPKKPKPGAAPK